MDFQTAARPHFSAKPTRTKPLARRTLAWHNREAMRSDPDLLSVPLEAAEQVLGGEEKAKEMPFKFHRKPRPPQPPAPSF